MGGQKPHLLISIKNNLGAETKVQYAPSTKFYLADKLARHNPGSPGFPSRCMWSSGWRPTIISAAIAL